MSGIGSHTKPNRGTTDSWITPPELIRALGDFDLDPCVCTPQPWECAKYGFSESQDGLKQEWFGRVWLNPPYGRQTGVWLQRLADHGCGTALIFARTETEMFFDQVWKRATAVLFIEKRLTFFTPEGNKGKSNSGGPSCLVAYGASDATKLRYSGISGAFVPMRMPLHAFCITPNT